MHKHTLQMCLSMNNTYQEYNKEKTKFITFVASRVEELRQNLSTERNEFLKSLIEITVLTDTMRTLNLQGNSTIYYRVYKCNDAFHYDFKDTIASDLSDEELRDTCAFDEFTMNECCLDTTRKFKINIFGKYVEVMYLKN